MRAAARTESRPKRAYSLGLRAQQAMERRERILEATHRLLSTSEYEEVSLEAVARAAEVALKTVVRHFGSKETLVVEAIRSQVPIEEARRQVAPGDVRGAARVLAARYEVLGPMILRAIGLQDRLPAVAEMMTIARDSHHRWLSQVFAPWLPPRRPKLSERRLAQLFGATELYVWHLWRERLGLGLREATQAMGDTLEALLARWDQAGGA